MQRPVAERINRGYKLIISDGSDKCAIVLCPMSS